MRRLILLLALMASLGHAPALLAVTCTSVAAGGNWNVPATWTGCAGGNGTVLNTPGTADTANIAGAGAVVVNVVSSAGVVNVNGGTLTQSSGLTLSTATLSGTLTINGGTMNSTAALTVNGPTNVTAGIFAPTVVGGRIFVGLVTIGGGAWNGTTLTAIYRGGITYTSGTFTSGTGIQTFDTNPQNITGTLSITNVTITGITLTNNGAFTIVTALAGAGTLLNVGTLNMQDTAIAAATTLNATTVGNIVNYNLGGAQTVKATAYNILRLSTSGAKTMTAVTTIAGDLTIQGTATMTGNAAFTVTGILNYNSTGATTLTAATAISIGRFSQTAGTLTDNGNTITVTGTGASTWARAAGTFTATGTVIFTGAAPQIGASNFSSLTINVGALNTATLTGIATPTGNLSVTTGTFDLATFTANRTAAGGTLTVANLATLKIGGTNTFPTNFTNPHTLGATSTVEYSGTNQTVVAEGAPGYGHLTLSVSGTKTMPAAAQAIRGDFTMSGSASAAAGGALTIGGSVVLGNGTTFNANTFSHSVAGNFTNNGTTFTPSTSTFTFNGTAAQAIGGTSATTFNNLTINNTTAALATRTVTLGNDITANNQLTFTSGRIVTGASKVILPSIALPVSGATGAPNERFVAGRLQKFAAAGAPTVTFEVGSDGAAAAALGYSPVTFVFSGVTATGGSFIVEPTAVDHPNIATSGLDSTLSVNRWWSASTTGVSGTALPAFTSYGATFTFIGGAAPAGDLDAGAVGATGNFHVRRRAAGVWNATAIGTRTATTTQITGVTALGEFAIGVRTVAHYAITGSAAALTCESTPVTFTGHNAVDVATAPPAGSVLNLSTGTTGLWEATLVAGTGTWTPSGSDNGVASYTWPGGETSFTARLRLSAPATLAINVIDNFGLVESEDLSVAYSNAAFRFVDSSDNNLPNQVAGTTSGALRLQAVQGSCVTPGACTGVCTAASVGDFRSGATTSVDLAFECQNPATCQAGQTLAFVNNGSTNIAGNPNGAVATYTAKSLTWGANGVASFTMNYSDVGQLRLHTRWPAGGPAQMSGASAPFVVRPFGFTLSNIIRTSDSFLNPAAANATGAAFIRAGSPFTLTATAIRNGGGATPNYGKETSPEGVLLTSALVAGLGLTAIPALANNVVPGSGFSAGAATVTNVNWGEVGIITITPSVGDGSYLGAGDVTGTATGNVGRFFPDHFALTGAAPTLTNRAVLACAPTPSSFSYMGEGMDLVFSLRAENLADSVTENYRTSGTAAQNFAKLSAASPSAYDFGARSGTTVLTGRISSIYPGSAPTFVAGVLALTAANPVRISVGRNNSGAAPQDNPDGPHLATAFGIKPVDSDLVAMGGAFDLDADAVAGFERKNIGVSTDLRFGRLRLTNAVGSEKIDLQVALRAEYWSGTGFATNTLDSCTRLDQNNIALEGYAGAIDPGLGNCKTFVNNAPITLSAGLGTIRFAKPSVSGSLRLTVRLGALGAPADYCVNAASAPVATAADAPLSGLLGRWNDTANPDSDANTAFDDNPAARAAFGVYGSQPRNFIFFRENY